MGNKDEWHQHYVIRPVVTVAGETIKIGPIMRRRVANPADRSQRYEYRAMTPEELADYESRDAW
jgi:hypothetical protein